MDRRKFLQLAAASPLLRAEPKIPTYHVVSRFPHSKNPGMPGPYPGQVVRVHSEKSIDAESEKIDTEVVRNMLSAGMRQLTGERNEKDAWARFFTPKDVIGIKVNCSGSPGIKSSPEIVAGIASNLIAIGVPAKQIYIYERFQGQVDTVHYDRYIPQGVQIATAEHARGDIVGYDPRTYVEVDFFGEEDTRSNLVRMVSETFTKIINVPNMKEHQAAGVTGCLKNIAYGHFSNVDRSHRWEKTNTYSFIGTLASTEPVRTKVVLNIMDGLKGVWHRGPFLVSKRFGFFPKQMMFGTDPVAMDRLLIDVIDGKRKAEGAPSIFDRSKEHLSNNGEPNPNYNRFIREPGHIEYASGLGLGVYDISKIKLKAIEL